MQISMEYFLRMLGAQRQTQQLKSVNIKQKIVTKNQEAQYSERLRLICDHFFNDKANKLEIEKVMPFEQKKTVVPLCNKLFNNSETVYKCYDCFIHQASVLCIKCFENGQHAGHRFKKFSSGGGNCDCGNPLALKKQGFCINHSGKIEIPEIPEKQREIFMQIFCQMIMWLFNLVQLKDPYAQVYGQVFFKYLTKLNTQSIYYNILSFQLLTKKSQKDTTFLGQFFKITTGKLPSSMIQLFFSMFALDQFKIILANQYLKAYNTIPKVQKSSFHSLYIQLFANDNIVFEVVNKFKNTIQVTKSQYDFQKYIADVNFISSIALQPAVAFYELYFKRNTTVPYYFLDQIQSKLQSNTQMHQVDLVTKYISAENHYYYLFVELYAKIKDCQQLMLQIVKGLFETLCQKYSYRKNKAVLPFHRALALGIFTIFKGQMQQLNITTIAKKINIQQELLTKIFFRAAAQVLNCLLDFAGTYVHRSYFDNYLALYMKSGSICGVFDQLFIKMAAYMCFGLNKTFVKLLSNKLQHDISTLAPGKTYNESLYELINRYIRLCEIIIQIAVTKSSQIICNQKLQLHNNKLKKERKQLFINILQKTGAISRQDLQIIQKLFIHNVKDDFLFENTQFNKANKKYSVKQCQEIKQLPQFYYEIYISKRKIGQNLLMEQDQKSVIHKLSKPTKYNTTNQQKLLNVLLPHDFLQKLVNFACEHAPKLQQKQQKNISLSLLCMLTKISYYYQQKQQFQQLKQKIIKLSPIEQQINKQQIKQTEDLRLQMLKKKSQAKKAKFLQKQKKVATKLSLQKQVTQQIQDKQICILCRDSQNKQQDLCYFSNLRYKKLMSHTEKQNRFGFVFDSCWHTVHYSCFMDSYKNNIRYFCPLCKASDNILMPTNVQYQNHAFTKAMDRTTYIASDLLSRYHIQKQQEQQQIFDIFYLGFNIMLNYLIQFIGFVSVLKNTQYDKKTWKLCKHLLKLLILQWNTLQGTQKQKLYQIYGKQLQYLLNNSQKIQNNKSSIVCTIKHCILLYIFNYIQAKQIQLYKIYNMYSKYINVMDLKLIKHNLGLLLSVIVGQQNQEIKQNNNIKRLQSYFKYYQPPQTVKQLIKLRDQITLKNCKNGHNICICCQCLEIVCSDCKIIAPHNRKHGSQCMYFNFLTGGLTFYLHKKYILKSIYENKLGANWDSSKDPEGYTLNKEFYDQLIENFTCHKIQDYFRNKAPNLVQESDLAQILNL